MVIRLICVAAVLSLASCSGGTKPENVTLQPVSGTVTLDGKPVGGVSIFFHPEPGTVGQGASGATDDSGKFTMLYKDGNSGVPAGKYRVLFTRLLKPDGKPLGKDEVAADVDAVNKLPRVYNDTEQTPIGAEVPEGGKTFDFKLNSKARQMN